MPSLAGPQGWRRLQQRMLGLQRCDAARARDVEATGADRRPDRIAMVQPGSDAVAASVAGGCRCRHPAGIARFAGRARSGIPGRPDLLFQPAQDRRLFRRPRQGRAATGSRPGGAATRRRRAIPKASGCGTRSTRCATPTSARRRRTACSSTRIRTIFRSRAARSWPRWRPRTCGGWPDARAAPRRPAPPRLPCSGILLAPPRSAKVVSLPLTKAPVSMLMRWPRSWGMSQIVWPCTTTLPGSGAWLRRKSSRIQSRSCGDWFSRAAAGPDAGMDENIIVLDVLERATSEKRLVACRQGGLGGLAQFLGGAGIGRQRPHRDAVGQQGLEAAIGQPADAVGVSVEKAQQRVLVVAHQPDGREARQRIVEQTFNDAPAVRSTIDVVADEDQRARDILGMALGVLRRRAPILAPGDRADRGCRRWRRRPCLRLVWPPGRAPRGAGTSVAT